MGKFIGNTDSIDSSDPQTVGIPHFLRNQWFGTFQIRRLFRDTPGCVVKSEGFFVVADILGGNPAPDAVP